MTKLDNKSSDVTEVTHVTYEKRTLELVPFNSQLELISESLSSTKSSQSSYSNYNRYNQNYQQNYYQNNSNSHTNEYALAAVAAAAAVQQQQQKSYLLQNSAKHTQHRNQYQPHKNQSNQYHQQISQSHISQPQVPQNSHIILPQYAQGSQNTSLLVYQPSYHQQLHQIQQQKTQTPSLYQMKQPQVFASQDSGSSEHSPSSSQFSDSRPTTQQSLVSNPPIDFKSNYLQFNDSSQSLLSPTLTSTNTGTNQKNLSQTQSSINFKLFDSIDSNNMMSSPLLLAPQSNSNNDSPPNMFLSTSNSSLNNGNTTSTSANLMSGLLSAAPSLLTPTLPSNTSNSTSNGSIWGLNTQTSLATGSQMGASTSSQMFSNFGGSSMW